MQDDEGEYVLYENYEKLENRCDKLCKNIDGKNERLRVLISGIQQLEANLSKAIDIGEWFFDKIPDNEMDNDEGDYIIRRRERILEELKALEDKK